MTQIFAQTLTNDTAGSANSALVQWLDANVVTADANFFTLSLEGPGSGTATSIAEMWVGNAAASGDPYDFDGNQVQVFVGGNGSFTLPVGTTVVTDTISLALDHTRPVLVAVIHSIGAGTDCRRNSSAGSGKTAYYKTSSDPSEAGVTNKSGYSSLAGWVFFVSSIDTAEAPSSTPPSEAPQTWNPLDKTASVTLTNSDLTAEPTATGYSGVRGAVGHKTGRKYFEVTIPYIDQACQFNLWGIAPMAQDLTNWVQVYSGGNPNQTRMLQIGFHGGGGHFTMTNVTIAVAVDFTTRKTQFRVKSNVGLSDWLEVSSPFTPGTDYFPATMFDWAGFGPTGITTLNVGASPFVIGVPFGYESWDGLQGSDSGAENPYNGTIVTTSRDSATASLNTAATKSAGATWDLGTTPTFDNGSSISYDAMAYSPKLRRWVAIAPNSPDAARQIITSPDGKTWTARTSPQNNAWRSVCWAEELDLFVAVASSGTNRVMTSPDGINWTLRTAAEANAWQSVCWCPGLGTLDSASQPTGLFVAVADTGTNRIMTSPDGETWTPVAAPATQTFNKVIWAAERGLVVAIAYGASGGTNASARSSDGVSWTAGNVSFGYNWQAIAYSPELDLFVTVANSGGGGIAYSQDLISWTTIDGTTHSWNDVIWGRSIQAFMAVEDNAVYISFDGANWTAQTSPGDRNWFHVHEGIEPNESPSSGINSDFFVSSMPASDMPSSAPASSAPASSAPASSAPASSAPASSTPASSAPASSAPSSAAPDIAPPVQVVVIVS